MTPLQMDRFMVAIKYPPWRASTRPSGRTSRAVAHRAIRLIVNGRIVRGWPKVDRTFPDPAKLLVFRSAAPPVQISANPVKRHTLTLALPTMNAMFPGVKQASPAGQCGATPRPPCCPRRWRRLPASVSAGPDLTQQLYNCLGRGYHAAARFDTDKGINLWSPNKNHRSQAKAP